MSVLWYVLCCKGMTWLDSTSKIIVSTLLTAVSAVWAVVLIARISWWNMEGDQFVFGRCPLVFHLIILYI